MKLIPTTPEDLIDFLNQYKLDALITEFEIKNNGNLTQFGLPEVIDINLSMQCRSKDNPEILEE